MVLEMSFKEFQDRRFSGHLRYRNGMILAILNLYVAPMLSVTFRLNPTDLGDVVPAELTRYVRPARLRSACPSEQSD